jgi:hypothetical protein
MNDLVEALYTPHLTAARNRFSGGAASVLVNPKVDPTVFELFLLNFCSRGVRMTEPVEGWISRAGARCVTLGWQKLGTALIKHAEQEANHHLMMIADTQKLVEGWNARREPRLDADALLSVPSSPAVESYVRLHEDVIAGPAPYAQLAIEFEIERISVTLGPSLMRQCKQLLGDRCDESLSFLVEHVEIDQGHTKFNERQLDKLLAFDRSFALQLIRAGSLALDIYGQFLDECLGVASTLALEVSGREKRLRAAQTVQA